MARVFGHDVKITVEMDCERGGDHRRLVMDARLDCLARAVNPDERFVVCGRCVKAISLKI